MKKKYSIGAMAKLCNTSQKTLRYYDNIHLLHADIHDTQTGYRYYDEHAFGQFMAIKYYQAAGVSLEEIASFQKATNMTEYINLFRECIKKKENELEKIKIQKESLEQWLILVEEGEKVPQQSEHPIRLKKIRRIKTLSRGTQATGHVLSEPISVYEKYIETGQMVYGAAYLEIPDIKRLLNNESQILFRHMEIHPDSFKGIDFDEIGDFVAISTIHTGSKDTIKSTYNRLIEECKNRNLVLRGDALERYVVDDCTTKNEKLFVTEIFLPLEW